ncbi:phosphonoacetate hydrolase [Halopenitus malekzadehii]|uniref:Phosphonoacetate hydrolase n=1 Tax=Halopenitus malekzadehii TaxID=1267564 RepID=A0A1H6IKP8_9EURY|nr:alkaline phosphatase family protein [Halopenitus malekzadehii]SEH50080.1 phosphonoacetate hydrolase [Halopenitus malekzadehii]
MTNVVICCDGLDPTYLGDVDTPGWDAIAAAGRAGTCSAAVPTLTNVNNVGIVTGVPPRDHGITGNTYYDAERGDRVYMTDPSFLRHDSVLQRAADGGDRAGALVVKEKLRRMIGRGCVVAASAEDPPTWLEEAIGPAPDIYSGHASEWVLNAAAFVLADRDLDWLYVSTTDVVPHKHAPDESRAVEWIRALDEGIATVADRADDVVVTADHGMSRKTTVVDLESILAAAGHDPVVVRLIRDRHTYHHRNLGGAAYVHVDDPDAAGAVIRDHPDIDVVCSRAEAAARFDLPPDRIGDLVVLGAESAVFGPVEDGHVGPVDVRSHGSHHEITVPYATTLDGALDRNRDAFDVFETSPSRDTA